MKTTLKLIFFALLLLCGFYLSILFFFDGFGKRRAILETIRKKDSVLLFAHRAMGTCFPENSLEGVDGAKAKGFNAVEVDITRSSDNELIVFHDKNCSRLLGLNQEVSALKTEEIKKHPILFNNHESSSYVATVEELLKNRKEDMVYYFDMKLSSFNDADDVARLIKKQGGTHSVILANWDILFILYVELKYPEIITALEGFDAGKEWTYYLMPRALRPDYFSGYLSNVNESHITWLKHKGLMPNRIIYGVDNSNVDYALLKGFKNIIMDYDSISTRKKTLVKNYLRPNGDNTPCGNSDQLSYTWLPAKQNTALGMIPARP